MDLHNPVFRENINQATKEGTDAYEAGKEFASCEYARHSLERCAWECAWRIADFQRKELIPG